jgi:hypothetical protein
MLRSLEQGQTEERVAGVAGPSNLRLFGSRPLLQYPSPFNATFGGKGVISLRTVTFLSDRKRTIRQKNRSGGQLGLRAAIP